MRHFNGHSKHYWQKKWDDAPGEPYRKALSLLADYSGGFRAPIGPGYWFRSTGRLLRGKWNTHHGKAVARMMDIHLTLASTAYDVDERERTVKNLLGDLKRKLGSSVMKPDGDLARIISVIEDSTGIVFDDIGSGYGVAAVQGELSREIEIALEKYRG
jgi:hypothetical protein